MNEKNKDIHPSLQSLIPIARGINQMFGKYCEVAVHDLCKPETSLVFLAGNVTKRHKGAPITNLVLESIRNHGDNCLDLIGYKNVTKDGRILKSSTIFARDQKGKIVGCLCINYDITELIIHKNHLEEFIAVGEKINNGASNEFFASDITEVLEGMIDAVLTNLNIPVAMMQKEDKIHVVRELDLKGVFMIKGAVDKVAAVLGVSRYTIYNYLEEDRSNRSNNVI
ncbi:YheO domain protein [Desulforamulus reducens MI-1]|uniref:YheO domain protein n=1 Tax=Desulforamulus reducens (strain ATCC BAA-1160 / DSM 100696 / MI-1) TaxID=349161 RepID=A4J495_DESRM|nr:PAS domain-containing protein [Desulforamulus reducens]ABO49898.1 YheO domain protein [Desulforamulus reducens MI-1]